MAHRFIAILFEFPASGRSVFIIVCQTQFIAQIHWIIQSTAKHCIHIIRQCQVKSDLRQVIIGKFAIFSYYSMITVTTNIDRDIHW